MEINLKLVLSLYKKLVFQLMRHTWPKESRKEIWITGFIFYILHQSITQEELRALWPTLLLFKARFISTRITMGIRSLPHKVQPRHDSCILITHFNSRTLLSNKNSVVNLKVTQHVSLYVVIKALLSRHALLVFLKWWPLAH